MGSRTLAVLLVVAAALGSFVWFYEIRGEEGRRQAEAEAKRLFPGVKAASIEWISLVDPAGRHVRAERHEGHWRIVEPLDFPGDGFALDGVASALAEVESSAVYHSPQPLKVYGLADESRELHFGVGDSEHAIRVGNTTPMGHDTYAWVAGGDAVYTVPTTTANAMRKSLDDLREKRVLIFDPSQVEEVSLAWPGGSVDLVREGEGWRLSAPLQAPADVDAVKTLLSDLSFLRAQKFRDEPLADSESGLDAPALSVRLRLPAASEGGEARSLALAIGSRVDDGTRWVRSDSSTLYGVAQERLDDYPRRVAAYRDRRLADFTPSDAKRLEMVFAEPSGAPVTVTATRGEEGWSAGKEKVSAEKLARLVDELSRLRADDILAESVGPDERKGLGLDPPRASFRVFGEEANPTPLAEIRLGEMKGSEGVVAQTGEKPQLYLVSLAVSEHLPVSLEAFRSRFAPEPAKPPATPAPAAPPPDASTPQAPSGARSEP